MAFLPDEQNLQNQAPQGGTSAQGQAPITSSPAPTAGGTGSKGTINQPSSQNGAQPFTNLQNYLTANQPQIEQQGNTIANSLTGQYGQTVGAIDQAKSDFGNTVGQSYTPTNSQVVNDFNTDPSKVAADPNAAKTFQGMYNDSYTGPGSFEGTDQYGQLVGQVQKGQQTAGQVTTPGGLSSYLQSNNPNESTGMATLDSSLVQGNPTATTAIANAAQPFAGLTNYLGGAAATGDAQIAAAVQQAQAAKAAAQGAFATKANGFNAGVQGELAAAGKQAQDFNKDFNGITANLNNTMPTGLDNGIVPLSVAQQAGLGINQSSLDKYAQANQILNQYGQAGAQEQNVLGQNGIGDIAAIPQMLSSYLSGGHAASIPTNVNAVATPADFQEAAALAKLGGSAYTSPLDPSQAGSAGSYKPDGQYQTFDQNAANGLFGQVNKFDTAMAGKPANYSSAWDGTNPVTPAADWITAYKDDLAQINAAGANGAAPNDTQSAILNALNRLANGFSAPPAGYTVQPVAPSIGGTTPTVNQPGRFVAK